MGSEGLFNKKNGLTARYRSQEHSQKLNLVSLMDIFTILVFFLMFNSSDVQVLEQNKNVTLPESLAKNQPSESLVILMTKEKLLVQNELVGNYSDWQDSDVVIPDLIKILERHDHRASPLSEEEQLLGREVVVMGDSTVPYESLKKVLASCSKTAYRQISLAVTRKEKSNHAAHDDAMAFYQGFQP